MKKPLPEKCWNCVHWGSCRVRHAAWYASKNAPRGYGPCLQYWESAHPAPPPPLTDADYD